MFGDLFDSPWKILIVAVVLIVLFGSKKLPYAARSLGQSMRILKREVQGLHEQDSAPGQADYATGFQQTGFQQTELAAGAPKTDQQSQIDALQQQIRDLQRSAAMDTPAPWSEPTESQVSQHTPQAGF
jgi:sec-independent protein translocase protein TatA